MANHKKRAVQSRQGRWIVRGTVVAVLVAGTVGFAGLHKTVTLDVNGTTVAVSTFSGNVGDILDHEGVTVGTGDLVIPTVQSSVGDGDVISVRTSSPVTLTVDGKQTTIAASAAATTDASRALAASRSDAVGRSELTTSSITLTVDGESRTVVTSATDVRTALQQIGVVLGADDVVTPGLDSEISDGSEIVIGKPETKIVTVTETDKFETVRKKSDSVAKGTTVVTQKGSDGEAVTTYSVETINGKEVSRTVVTQSVTTKPTDQIVIVGTGDASSGGSSGSSGTSSKPVAAGTARAIAKQMLADRGWGDDQFACLDTLWQHESGWRTTAGNQSSGAYGIPQALPGSKMASAGSDWRTSAETQIKWGLGYIKARYSTPCGAWAHFQSHNWY